MRLRRSLIRSLVTAALASSLVSCSEVPVQQLAVEEETRNAWFQAVPHPASPELCTAVLQAAWTPPSNIADQPSVVQVTQGNLHSLKELLPRWLDSLANTRDGDITRHTVVVALGQAAMDMCRQQQYSHRCVLDTDWPGPDTQYTFATPWYEAVTLHKVEVLQGILGMGHSALWLDTDIVHMGSPLPYVTALAADVAVSSENCRSDLAATSCDDCGPNTGVLYLKAGPAAERFVSMWLALQRQHLLEWAKPTDYHDRRTDQVTMTKYALPAALNASQPGGPWLNATMLSPSVFPNYCGGECGCDGAVKRPATRFLRHENDRGHLTTGRYHFPWELSRVQCPGEVVDAWLLYHFPCASSTHEKLALIDAFQGLHNHHLFRSRGKAHLTQQRRSRRS